jgi:hypothetical protein
LTARSKVIAWCSIFLGALVGVWMVASKNLDLPTTQMELARLITAVIVGAYFLNIVG